MLHTHVAKLKLRNERKINPTQRREKITKRKEMIQIWNKYFYEKIISDWTKNKYSIDAEYKRYISTKWKKNIKGKETEDSILS